MTGRSRRSRPGGGECRLSLDLGTVATPLLVRRHPRARRISLRITAEGSGVVVVLPSRGRLEDGVAVAREHAAWICARLAALPARVPFADGAILPVHGRPLVIRHRAAERPTVHADGDDLRAGGAAEDVAHRIAAWLRSEARRVLAERIPEKAERLGRAPARIAVRDTRSRWGSCSPTGTLSFSWRLILAPPHVLDYVVAHEMAHLAHRGHGPEFWRTVASLVENVEQSRVWLRVHGRELFRYG